jgi:hypothetical protein
MKVIQRLNAKLELNMQPVLAMNQRLDNVSITNRDAELRQASGQSRPLATLKQSKGSYDRSRSSGQQAASNR